MSIRGAWRRFGAACLLAVAAAPATAAIAPARARATLIEPLSLINTAPLSFGDISSGATAGTVVVSPTGLRTVTGGVTALGGTVNAAGFAGAASGRNVVIIRSPEVPVTLTRIGGGATMQISAFTIEGGRLRLFTSRQAFDFRIGGTLQVSAAQAEGVYEGTFEVTIDYL